LPNNIEGRLLCRGMAAILFKGEKTMTSLEAQRLASLSEEDLLGEFLPKESAKHLLREYANIYNVVFHTSDYQLKAVPGVGGVKLKRLLCVREVVSRVKQYRTKTIRAVHSPEDVMQFFHYLEDKEQEELWVLLLNTKNHIIQARQVSVGSINSSTAFPREVFHAAVQSLAASIIIVHNHPSGEAYPSQEDMAVTKEMIKAGKIMEIPLLDHVIIAKRGNWSIKESNPTIWEEGSKAA